VLEARGHQAPALAGPDAVDDGGADRDQVAVARAQLERGRAGRIRGQAEAGHVQARVELVPGLHPAQSGVQARPAVERLDPARAEPVAAHADLARRDALEAQRAQAQEQSRVKRAQPAHAQQAADGPAAQEARDAIQRPRQRADDPEREVERALQQGLHRDAPSACACAGSSRAAANGTNSIDTPAKVSIHEARTADAPCDATAATRAARPSTSAAARAARA
jgi:hypothetical protein